MISITLHTPEKVLQVSVNKQDNVNTLQKYYNPKATTFLIHDSKVIFTRFTFGFLKINDGDHIYAVSQKEGSNYYKFTNKSNPKIKNEIDVFHKHPLTFGPGLCLDRIKKC